MRHIGVMGGAFNPIHTRHLMVAQRALDLFQLEKVIFVPSGNPPHKKQDLLDKEIRFRMVVAGIADNPRFEASRLEVDRPGESWTIDTLKELQQALGPDVRLSFIIGEDNINVLRLYDRRAEFLSLCRLLVSPRGSADPQALDTWRQLLPEGEIELIDCPVNATSSTLVRTWVRNGQSVRYLVPAAVADIIESEGHYKQPPAAPAPAAVATATAVDSSTAAPAVTADGTGDNGEATTPAAESFPLYRSLPVLTVVPDRADGSPDDVERGVLLLDSDTGARAADARSTAPQVVRAFAWWNASRAEVKALREFVNNRRGRARPFWAPSWQQDFALASDHAPGASVLVVRARDYAARVSPAGQGRRHLAVRTAAGATYYRHVEGAVDNLNGTESLTLDLAIPDALAAATTLTSSLRFYRLDTDEPRFEWSGGQFATCSLPVRELPSEAPA